jgi:hypothetical protein
MPTTPMTVEDQEDDIRNATTQISVEGKRTEVPAESHNSGGTITEQPQLQQMDLRGGFIEFIDRGNIENPCLRCLLCGYCC